LKTNLGYDYREKAQHALKIIKKKTIKILKKASREKIPISSLRGKIIPSKKRKLVEKSLKRDILDKVANND
jgi:hypothetical protein